VEEIRFLAIIPHTQTAIRLHGEGGARLTLDVDMTQEDELLKLKNMRDVMLVVTIRPERSFVYGRGEAPEG